jgi:hypothetical protein
VSEDLESQLRAALRPVAPRDEFTQALIGRIGSANGSRPRRRAAAWLTVSLAASLLVAVGIRQHVQDQRNRESGLEARRQVIEALRVTSQKLDLAYEAIKSQSAAPDETPGA